VNSGDLDGQAVPAPLVTPFVLLLLNHTRGKNQTVLTTSEIYPWSFVTHLIKKIAYWLGSMFGVEETKYMLTLPVDSW
jgi:hypothetical protein